MRQKNPAGHSWQSWGRGDARSLLGAMECVGRAGYLGSGGTEIRLESAGRARGEEIGRIAVATFGAQVLGWVGSGRRVGAQIAGTTESAVGAPCNRAVITSDHQEALPVL